MITRLIYYAVALILVSGFTGCKAQTELAYREDKVFAEKMNHFVQQVKDTLNVQFGIGMAVVQNDHMIYETYQGMASLEEGIPVTPETPFYIASSTKSFTALAMLSLHEKGVLDLDRSLASYFTEYEFDPALKADQVNLRHLLLHTSGLENNNITFSKAYTGMYSLESLTDNLVNNTRVDPRSGYGKFKYSNLGYNIIELILERELGKDWKAVVREEVLEPLEMAATTANISDLTRDNRPGALPYMARDTHGRIEALELRKQDSILHAAGGLISTPRDMARFLIAQLTFGEFDGKQVFPEQMIRFAQTSHAAQDRKFLNLNRTAYGYGWNIATTPLGDTLIHHYGAFPGTSAQVSFMPEHNLGLSIYANEGRVGLLATFLMSSYAFDYFAGREDLDTYYGEQLVKYKQMITKGFAAQAAGVEKRKEREWQLDLDIAEYAGTYYCSATGAIDVYLNGHGALAATMGYLRSGAFEPFTMPNSARVELIPGSGSVFQFKVDNGRVVALEVDGLRYERQL